MAGLRGRIEVNLRTAEVKRMGEGFAREFAETLGAEIVRLAKDNVKPHSGPGPHPHRPQSPHIDTGKLAESVSGIFEDRGFLKTVRVQTDVPYGLYLEAGWTARSGLRYRYPWLMPAMMQAQQQWEGVVRSTARRWFADTGSPYRGRVNFEAPLSGTAWPESGE